MLFLKIHNKYGTGIFKRDYLIIEEGKKVLNPGIFNYFF
jgi:hypothetical protein